jgi:hypothetical protein
MMKIFNFCASHISLEDSTFALRAKMKGVVKGHDNEGCIDPASWVKSSRAKGIGGFSPRSGEIGGREREIGGPSLFFSFFVEGKLGYGFFSVLLLLLTTNFFFIGIILRLWQRANVGLRPTKAAKMMKKAAKQVDAEENRLMHFVH